MIEPCHEQVELLESLGFERIREQDNNTYVYWVLKVEGNEIFRYAFSPSQIPDFLLNPKTINRFIAYSFWAGQTQKQTEIKKVLGIEN